MEKKHYNAIDGLRMIAAFGIVMMHIRSNTDYAISGFLYDQVITSFTNFVFMFMTVSAFGMCCGYYERVLNNQLNLPQFYSKRFKKVLPFFGILVLLDIIMAPSIAAMYEGFADLTLLFGFIPNDISVIGVGWFLGLVFVFYIMFPFFCVLLENKRRAWITFIISLIYNFVCTSYFDVGRKNILYSACFFVAGGLIYLYRDEITKINKWFAFSLAVGSVVLYYAIGGNVFMYLFVSSSLLIYAMVNEGRVLVNKITKFFSGISMEIYLAHMVIFRLVEKMGLNRIFGDGWIQYIWMVFVVLLGTTIFAAVMKKLIAFAWQKADRIKSR